MPRMPAIEIMPIEECFDRMDAAARLAKIKKAAA